MARNIAGFGEGLSQGFGLVNDFYSSKRKADIAEEELASDKAYREGLLKDREAGRANDKIQNKAIMDLRTQTADTNKINASAAQTRANTGLLNAQNDAKKYNPDGSLKARPASALDQQRLLTSEAQLEVAQKRSSALDDAAAEKRQVVSDERAAIALDQVFTFANSGQIPQAYGILENSPELFDPKNMFSFEAIYNPDNAENFAATNRLLEAAASGTVTPEQANNPYALAGIGQAIGAHRSKLINSTIDANSFPNAPVTFHEGRLDTTGILNLEVNQDNQLSATVFNEVELKDGTFAFYYSPLTENRASSVTTNTGVTAQAPKALFSLEEGAQLLYSRGTVTNYALDNPVAKGIAEEKIQERKHGSVDKFNQELDSRVEEFGNLISKKDADSNIQGVGDDYGIDISMTPGEFLARKEEVREKFKHNMMYGRSAVSDTRRAQQYLERLRSDVPNFEVVGRMGRKKFKDYINEPVETLTPGQLSKINEFFVGSENTFGLGSRKETLEKENKFVELLTSMDFTVKN